MINNIEIPLSGGRSTLGIVRIGDTVHRSTNSNSSFVHKLLLLLEEKGFKYAPKYLGMDEQGREILSFVKGDMGSNVDEWSDEHLSILVNMIKEFHDATEGIELVGEGEVICHNDLAPWNTVVVNGEPIAFIDFDDATPGYRINDFAYFLWTFLKLGNDTPLAVQADRISTLTSVYGSFTVSDVMGAILDQQKRILEKRKYLSENAMSKEEREFSKYKIDIINVEISWIVNNRDYISTFATNSI